MQPGLTCSAFSPKARYSPITLNFTIYVDSAYKNAPNLKHEIDKQKKKHTHPHTHTPTQSYTIKSTRLHYSQLPGRCDLHKIKAPGDQKLKALQ